MTAISPILGPRGEALPASRPHAIASTAYDAADYRSQELASFMPPSGSADRDILREQRLIVDRIRDLERNHGWASGAMTRELDVVIGYNFRPEPKPDHVALGISIEAAAELGNAFERAFTAWANCPRRLCDATRHDNWYGLSGLGYRHRSRDGEALALLLWRLRGGEFNTCLRVVDPDRLSNPMGVPDDDTLRGGVHLNADGAAIGYHIRRGHPRDVGISAATGLEWDYVPRETDWGRPLVIHDFERKRDGQHRGLSDLVAVVKTMKMADRYQGAELQTAVLNALLAAFIESPFDHEFLMDLLGEPGGDKSFDDYQDKRAAFHDKRGISMGGIKIPALFPGEKIGMIAPVRPSSQMDSFMGTMLRNFAACRPTHTAETVSLDYSRINYSSARAAMLVAARSILRERLSFGVRFGQPVYHAVIEEAVMSGMVELPPGAPDFHDALGAYLACDWMGPAMGWVDPVKEAQAAGIRMDFGLSTLQQECADQGRDWRDVMEQRARERAYAVKLGLPDSDQEKAMKVKAPTDTERRNTEDALAGYESKMADVVARAQARAA